MSALFSGTKGTGKTMAAGILANHLKQDHYRIDLSFVVSKYIGETEKNLHRLLDTANQSETILSFDEADALFGKRSEVNDSYDRYVNIRINYRMAILIGEPLDQRISAGLQIHLQRYKRA